MWRVLDRENFPTGDAVVGTAAEPRGEGLGSEKLSQIGAELGEERVDGGGVQARHLREIDPRAAWPTLVLVHTPVRASWLNGIEIYFSIVQRKVLIPNDFTSFGKVEDRLLRFQEHYEQLSQAFEWRFTRYEFLALLDRLAARELPLPLAA